MKNLDAKNMTTIRQNLFDAMQSEDKDVQVKAFADFTDALQEDIMNRAKAEMENLTNSTSDNQILVNRGVRKAFTSEEMKYFNAVVAREGFAGVEEEFPVTIVQEIFNNLKTEHPLISRVDAKDVTGLVTFVLANPNAATAYWGPICADISQMILEGFKEISLKASRLSGFVAICKGMLDLGPNYLGQYIYETIYEIMSTALEVAIVTGNGQNKPVGMLKSLSNGTVQGDSTVIYADKVPVALTDLTPATLSGPRALLAEKKLDKGEVLFIVNPVTYFLKVFPKLAKQTDSGAWVVTNLPTGETVVQSHAVPVNKAIVGDAKNYFLGVSGALSLTEYKETLAIEDMNLYIAKMYATGQPKDKDAFIVLGLTGISGGTKPAEDVDVTP